MSSIPPPTPPNQPPFNDPNAWRAQRQAMKAQRYAMRMQARMQRAQMKAQMRAMRRGSIAGPVLLLALGVVFLLAQTGKMSWWHVATWYGTWWPVVLIGAGLILLAEWAYDQHLHPDAATRGRRTLGGGVIFLLILMGLIGVSTWGGTRIYEHSQGQGIFFNKDLNGWDHFGNEHDEDASLNSVIGSAESLIVRNPHGDVTVTGASTDGQVHVSAHKQAWSWQDSDAEAKERRLEPLFTDNGSSLVLSVETVEGGQDDLTVQMPAGTALTIEAGHGDISVTGMRAAVKLTQNHGDVELEDITGSVDAHIQDDNASVQAHTIRGGLLIEGRSGDVNLSDVTGDVNLQGDFFGTTHLERVNGLVRFDSSRTQFAATRLDGQLEIERGELQGDQLLGPVTLNSINKDISLERVAGSVKIYNRGKGDITVSNAPPLAPITIDNEHGEVNVGVPDDAGFVLSAQAKHGDVENDFGVMVMGDNALHTANQTVGHGGPAITISTQGGVIVRKSAQQPLPPAPPAPPAAPPAPKAPKLMGPKPPSAPKVPPSQTF
jgi:DUF4097 and DUF4098 domain-containing protein YvlB